MSNYTNRLFELGIDRNMLIGKVDVTLNFIIYK